jgi:hypothetical protein
MITLEWVKTIAENLRLGLYGNKISFMGTNYGGVKITDINNNIVLEIASQKRKSQTFIKKWNGKEIIETEYYCDVHCVAYDAKAKEFLVHKPFNGISDDYAFWSDFSDWIKQKREDVSMQAELKAIETFTL